MAVDSASPAGGREIWAGTLACRVAEAVAPVTLRGFRSAWADAALSPADTDGGQFVAECDRNSGGGHLATSAGGPQARYCDFVCQRKIVALRMAAKTSSFKVRYLDFGSVSEPGDN